jgi:hypothetical protein
MTAILAVSYDSPGDISPGALGFIVVAALAVALFFLLRSMNKHLRKVSSARAEGRELGEPPDGGGPNGPDGPGGAGGPGGPADTAEPAGAVPQKRDGSAGG